MEQKREGETKNFTKGVGQAELTLKRLGRDQFELPPCGFSKNVPTKERMKPWFFVTFNIILRHIFPENFIEFPQVVQKI